MIIGIFSFSIPGFAADGLCPVGDHRVWDPTMSEIRECYQQEEVFGFEIKDYPMDHQKQSLVNLSIQFRFMPTVQEDPNLYPDLVLLTQEVEDFLVSYPNETDYWEILTRNLANFLLDQYPVMSSLRVKVMVYPTTLQERYERYSVVTLTRPDQCPIL